MGSRSLPAMGAWLTVLLLVPLAMADEPDVEPPVISEVSFYLIGETWFTVGWTTSEPALGGVEWGRGQELDHVAEEEGEPRTDHFLNVTGLTRGSDHRVRIFATDGSNNTGYSGEWTVSTYPVGWEERFWSRYATYVLATITLAAVVALAFLAWERWRRRPQDGPGSHHGR